MEELFVELFESLSVFERQYIIEQIILSFSSSQ